MGSHETSPTLEKYATRGVLCSVWEERLLWPFRAFRASQHTTERRGALPSRKSHFLGVAEGSAICKKPLFGCSRGHCQASRGSVETLGRATSTLSAGPGSARVLGRALGFRRTPRGRTGSGGEPLHEVVCLGARRAAAQTDLRGGSRVAQRSVRLPQRLVCQRAAEPGLGGKPGEVV
jgi:hypothetical protein